MDRITARDDMKDLFAHPRLYYPGMLLEIYGSGTEPRSVTVDRVVDRDGPWVELWVRPTTRWDEMKEWLRLRALDARIAARAVAARLWRAA